MSVLSFSAPFYIRYVDDIILAVPIDEEVATLDIFNTFHPRLQFTMEVGTDNKLNFLDVIIMVQDDHFIFDWYHKPTFSGRYLNYFSQHPVCQKKGTIIGLTDRVFLLSNPIFHQKNFNFIIKILIDNGYPIKFIFDIINFRLKHLLNNSNVLERKKNINLDLCPFFLLPYVRSISKKFSSIIRRADFRPAYTDLDNLKPYIKAQKDPLPRFARNNVVYRINCMDCEASYVGQTKRLKTRISEHRNQINNRSQKPSVITEHKLQYNHEFDWDNV